MNTEESVPGRTVEKPRLRGLWVLVVVSLCVVGALLAKSRLNRYSSFEDFDPSPIPRPTKNAPFIVTPNQIVDRMIDTAHITDKDMVYDLGCGDGRLVISAAVKSGCRGVGFDIDPQRVVEATENTKLNKVDQLVEIRQGDVFKIDLQEADVILMYLLPQMLRDLVPQIDKCRPGTRLVSHDFKIEGVEPESSEQVSISEGDRSFHFVHYYVTPLKKLPPRPRAKYRME